MTAEAEETLETVEKGVIYIIGGIVDRNRMPGICDNRAKELGITRKRLPIKENITVSWKDQLETSLGNITSKPHFDYDLLFLQPLLNILGNRIQNRCWVEFREFWDFHPTESTLNLHSGTERSLKIHKIDTKIATIPWNSEIENHFSNFCVSDSVGGQLRTK